MIIPLLLPSFIALGQPSNIAWLGSVLTCGFWEVDDELEHIALFIIKPLGLRSTLCLYCYAMLVDVVWVSVSMTDVSIVN